MNSAREVYGGMGEQGAVVADILRVRSFRQPEATLLNAITG
jgi:hypothetical protein